LTGISGNRSKRLRAGMNIRPDYRVKKPVRRKIKEFIPVATANRFPGVEKINADAKQINKAAAST
jgi:hypothetical protein